MYECHCQKVKYLGNKRYDSHNLLYGFTLGGEQTFLLGGLFKYDKNSVCPICLDKKYVAYPLPLCAKSLDKFSEEYRREIRINNPDHYIYVLSYDLYEPLNPKATRWPRFLLESNNLVFKQKYNYWKF